jgi:hypothetical protein
MPICPLAFIHKALVATLFAINRKRRFAWFGASLFLTRAGATISLLICPRL